MASNENMDDSTGSSSEAWKTRFDALTRQAYGGSKVDRQAMAQYRQMRNEIAASTQADSWPSEQTKIEQPSSFPNNDDPLSWASYLQAPLLVVFHQSSHCPDGDLGNECWRRCKFPSDWRAEGTRLGLLNVTVVRDCESLGYPRLSVAWPLTILALSAKRKKVPSLMVQPAYKQAKSELVQAIKQAESNLVVMNGLPFYNKSDPLAQAADLLLDVLEATDKRTVFVGRHAHAAQEILRTQHNKRVRKQSLAARGLPFFVSSGDTTKSDFEHWSSLAMKAT